MAVTRGIVTVGLEESIEALNSLGPEYRQESKRIFTDAAKALQRAAQGRIGSGGNRNKSRKPMIGRSGTTVGLRASNYPYALPGEFGQIVAHVYGRKVGESRMRRRISPPYRPPTSSDPAKNRGGYMIQPALRVAMPKIQKQASVEMTALIDKSMRRAGVPRG